MCVAIWVYNIREKKTKHCYGDVKMEDKDKMKKKKRERNNLIEISEKETTTTSFHCFVCLIFSLGFHVTWLKRTKFPNITLMSGYMTSAFTSIDEYEIVFNFNFEFSSISL